ncbi:hypothetical protein H6G04_25200 [Calothrix membranacea FACHB-236]|nr:hypothetical protein [Tolypothrix sp. PCC 7910]MBD2167689.1 hypothetical protein [Calothrix membranacea FACHB-236]
MDGSLAQFSVPIRTSTAVAANLSLLCKSVRNFFDLAREGINSNGTPV